MRRVNSLRFCLFACFLLLGVATLGACAPRLQPIGEAQSSLEGQGSMAAPTALLPQQSWRTEDGRVLPLRQWPAEGQPRAVVIALHGFNDYGNAFADPAAYWAKHDGIITYAPDQRGFGASPYTGLWPGADVLAGDLLQLTRLLRQRHPGLPVYWLGESMGGAVALVALGHTGHERVDAADRPDGVMLSAPAVWGRASMPLSYRVALALTSYTVPWMTFSGRGLGIQASDNIPMLRRLGADPLVIKRTRADAIHGLVGLMDKAAASPGNLGDKPPPLLVLYGLRDEVIPKPPVERFVAALGGHARVALYANGWHMLLRDLEADKVWRDLAVWMKDTAAALPSGAETARRPLFVGPASAADGGKQ